MADLRDQTLEWALSGKLDDQLRAEGASEEALRMVRRWRVFLLAMENAAVRRWADEDTETVEELDLPPAIAAGVEKLKTGSQVSAVRRALEIFKAPVEKAEELLESMVSAPPSLVPAAKDDLTRVTGPEGQSVAPRPAESPGGEEQAAKPPPSSSGESGEPEEKK
ncbi:MAG: hypothetical protein GMKNLPBB_01919 [Myxococcota bacterium]|nr:hypothetical protein [Myxococcota bacterium]